MREFRGWAKGAVASPFSVRYCFKRFLSKINAGINIVGNCTSPGAHQIWWAPVPAPVSEYSGLPPLFLQKESRGLKNHVVMKLIVDHSPLLCNVSCCVLWAVFLCPEKNCYYQEPLPLGGYPVSRLPGLSVSFFGTHGLLVVAKLMSGAIRKSYHSITNKSIC